MSNVVDLSVLPIWKRNASAYERMMELALYARAFPDKFDKFAVIYVEKTPKGTCKPRIISYNSAEEGKQLDWLTEMGIFETAKQLSWESSKL